MLFTLHTKAMPAPRPRARAFNVRGKAIVSMYHPKEYTEYQKTLAAMIHKAADGFLFDGPVSVKINVCLARPKTTKLDAPKPDVDNFAKGILDSMVKAGTLADDTIVHKLTVIKQWFSDDRIVVEVEPFA